MIIGNNILKTNILIARCVPNVFHAPATYSLYLQERSFHHRGKGMLTGVTATIFQRA